MRRSFRSTTALAAVLALLSPATLLAEVQLSAEGVADSAEVLAQADPVAIPAEVPVGDAAQAGTAPTAEALAESLAQTEAETPAEPVVVPGPEADAPAEPVTAEPEPLPEPTSAPEDVSADSEPLGERSEPVPVPEPQVATEPEPEVVEPAIPAEPIPAPEPQVAPEAEAVEPTAPTEPSDPIPAPEPQVAPAPEVVEPTPPAERSEPISAPEPQVAPEPEVVEPTAPTEPSDPIPAPEPQVAPAPEVVEPTPPAERSEPVPVPEAEVAPDAVMEPAASTPEPTPEVEVQAEPAAAPDAETTTPDAAALAAALAAAGGDAPVVAPADATAAATGQPEAPTVVEVDDDTARSLEETLRQAAEARRQQPAPAEPASANDAAEAAAAAGTAPVVEALSAPATIADDATAVEVTEDSARSASEDFATRLTEGLTQEQLQQFLRQQQGEGSQVTEDDDNSKRDLARLLLAGMGGYVLANVLGNDGQIALSTPDRVVVQQPDGTQTIIKDDNALLMQPGARVTTEDFADGSSRSIVTRQDGSRVVTIRDANLRVLRRTLIAADGGVTELIDDAVAVDPVVVAELPPAAQPIELSNQVNEEALRAALARETTVERRFTLSQIRNIPEVRGLVAPIEIDAITFDTGSAAIRPDQAQQLATLGKVISDYVRANPGEVFLIEGHTDTVGAAAMNLALSDRRAESVALALAQYFQVPPENMVVQGYGEQHLKVNQEGDVRANRRAAVRRITDLLAAR